MTDDPDLTPEQETRVRRLLTDARHTEPIPGDVVARLDRVLAQLAVDDVGDDVGDTGPVVSLAARRRRRVGSLLAAAAAVVAVGIGLGQLTGGPHEAADTASSDAGSTMREAPEGANAPTPHAPTYALKSPVPIRPDRFSRDVARLQHLTSDEPGAGPYAPQSGDSGNGADMLSPLACRPGRWGGGTFVPVTYGGEPGVVVLRRVTGDTQVADLFPCGSSEVLRSITLPAP